MRTCTICSHKKRTFIEAAIAVGESLRDIAGRFHVSKSALERHKAQHMQPLVQEVLEEKRAETKHILSSALDYTKRDMGLIAEALALVWSPTSKDVEMLLPVLRESHRQNRLYAMLTGELRRHSITDTPEWQEAISLLFEALKAYPDAQQAVITQIEEERAKRRGA